MAAEVGRAGRTTVNRLKQAHQQLVAELADKVALASSVNGSLSPVHHFPGAEIESCSQSQGAQNPAFRFPVAGMADDPPPDESTVQAAIALAWLSNSAPPSPAGPRHAYGIPLCAGSAADQDLSTEKAPFSAPLRLRMRSAFEASSDEDPEQGERGLSDDDDDDDQDPDGHDEEQHQAGTTPGTTTARTWPRPHTARGLPTHPAHGRRTQLVIIPWPRHDRGTGCMHAKKVIRIHYFLYSFSLRLIPCPCARGGIVPRGATVPPMSLVPSPAVAASGRQTHQGGALPISLVAFRTCCDAAAGRGGLPTRSDRRCGVPHPTPAPPQPLPVGVSTVASLPAAPFYVRSTAFFETTPLPQLQQQHGVMSPLRGKSPPLSPTLRRIPSRSRRRTGRRPQTRSRRSRTAL